MLIPRHAVPHLQLQTLDHGAYDLIADAPDRFSLVVFYRGLHCPICAKYLLELGRLQADFEKRGVKVIVVSSDTAELAWEMSSKVNATAVRFGSGWAR